MTKISPGEYAERRRSLLRMMKPGAIALVPAAAAQRRNADVHHVFRQDSDFWYLTGFNETDALLVLRRGSQGAAIDEGEDDEAILFCREPDERDSLYNGERLGPEQAAESLRLSAAFAWSAINEQMPALVGDAEALYCPHGEDSAFDQRLTEWLIRARGKGLQPKGEIRSIRALLHEQRLFKSAAEIGLMRRACEITVDGHLRAMRNCRHGLMERELEAELLYAFLRGGAGGVAYPSIVAGGANACVLHYVANSAVLKQGDLVLIDAGCEYENYAADSSRTFPVSGRFRPTQTAIYEIVLEAQLAAISACAPGISFDAPDAAALKIMQDGLERLGLWRPSSEQEDDAASQRGKFCPHKSSHWLGLDVHDCAVEQSQGEERTLAPGMVLTVEPGLYIPPDAVEVADKWRGLGVRIEDDVLITNNGAEVLTKDAPKEIGDIERVMAGG